MLWEAWKLSQAYKSRPSEIYGVTGYQSAFMFDRAVYRFGSHIDAELQEVDGKSKKEIQGKRTKVMQKYFPTAAPRKFADPVNRS